MNIIEQLGGYEQLKGYIDGALRGMPDSYCYKFDTVLGREKLLNMRDVKCILLEYRRQHSIFEVGDLITHPAYDWKILKVHDPIKSENLLFAKTNDQVKHHWGHGLVFDDKYVVAVSYSGCRHATDAEIQAGRRL